MDLPEKDLTTWFTTYLPILIISSSYLCIFSYIFDFKYVTREIGIYLYSTSSYSFSLLIFNYFMCIVPSIVLLFGAFVLFYKEVVFTIDMLFLGLTFISIVLMIMFFSRLLKNYSWPTALAWFFVFFNAIPITMFPNLNKIDKKINDISLWPTFFNFLSNHFVSTIYHIRYCDKIKEPIFKIAVKYYKGPKSSLDQGKIDIQKKINSLKTIFASTALYKSNNLLYIYLILISFCVFYILSIFIISRSRYNPNIRLRLSK